ncbi:hypothetical protein AGABI1DRAFT_94713 [Agaricus bisporus var. burnettii JB137-S8]|uniref:NACHT domain-containing protein n=1 Tax=Agaricus bisporus var. burnettii (strain JB137-S8 / ATCC MYA-4627 / FGSC 10392) TaxID=597362 RepID=K5XM76_AGABU|nr:uncharacterized protein AGABI1DRAFT_94713 [Agaricus bisporus var. burnettii JB137-S8]EKM75645.1 hypothetical protein AGABI1DRAFT_94713 [Agaricus bisporus var. burnettii JB137-S8]
MPAFSFHRPRFMRSGRSRTRSPNPSSTDPCNDTAVSPSHGLNFVNAAPSASHPSIPGNVIHQNSTGCPPLNRAPVQLSQASRPVTPIDAVPMLDSHNFVVQQDTQLAPLSDYTDSVQTQQPSVPLPIPYIQVTASQQSFDSESPTQSAGQVSPQWQHKIQGIFDHARDFSMTGPTFVDGNKGNVSVTNLNINTLSSQFMKELLKETIPGAASDSSARDPPPRCLPGTRLAILERCIDFIANCEGEKKIRWVVGSAGVGKSAIMQSVADTPNLPVTCHVSVFFSINGRDDGTKAIITLSYQFAAKSAVYRHLIESEIARDPSLLQSSIRVLVIIDGLDECKNPRTQQELLRLISDFCIKYPSSPVVWLIASRPERHITSFFARASVSSAYEKEEIHVDSDDGRADVERFLREELKDIKEASDALDPHSEWPEELDLWKLANASGGLFAYAHTAIRYIDDSNIGNPVSQFSDVLNVIDKVPMTGISREEHPMALLDALYARILFNVPPKVIIHTRKLILALASEWDRPLIGSDGWLPDEGETGEGNFVVLCNWLAMTPDEAYAAVNLLQSVLNTPKRDEAHLEKLETFHKSFIDYVSDPSRSDLFTDIHHEAQQLKIKCAFRILNEAPNGIDIGKGDYGFFYGILRRGPGIGDKISLTWPVIEGVAESEDAMRLKMYKLAIGVVANGTQSGDSTFRSEFCIRLLAAQFKEHMRIKFYLTLSELVFAELMPKDESRRHEFMVHGTLKQMPLMAINTSNVHNITLRFRRPARTVASGVSTILNVDELLSYDPAKTAINSFDPWNSSCRTYLESSSFIMNGQASGKKERTRTGRPSFGVALRNLIAHFAVDGLDASCEAG